MPPVISFALGSLGFLTKFDFENYSKIIHHCLSDGMTVSLRLRFEGQCLWNGIHNVVAAVDGALFRYHHAVVT